MQFSSQSQLIDNTSNSINSPYRIPSQPPSSTTATKLTKISTTIIQKQLQLCSQQYTRLQWFISHLQTILNNINRYKSQSYQQQLQLKQQIHTLEQTINDYKCSSPNTIHMHQQSLIENKHSRFVEMWNQRITITRTINVNKLYNLDIEDKLSLANHVFKFILVVFYNQPIMKYYWPNFKRQAFKNDGGQDFIQRLSRIDPRHLKSEQLSKLKSFLNQYQHIALAKQLQPALQQIQKIHQIAIRHLRCYQLSAEIQHIKQLIQKEKLNIVEKDDQLQREIFRLQALNSKVQNVRQFLQLMTSVQKKIKNKKQLYLEVMMKIKDAKQKFKKDKLLLESHKITQEQMKEYCECSIL